MRPARILFFLILIAFAVQAFGAAVYVCPMPDHKAEYDKPGTCPICGMTLVEKNSRFRVAVLVFNYAEDIDFTAPIEVLGHTGAQIFTVATSTDPITTVFGLHIKPDYDLEHAPAADLILIPGGGVGDSVKNERVISWIRDRAKSAKYVMSVCNGAFILAKTGLLDGLKATTTAGRIDELAADFPKIRVLRERVVDNGKFITAGGLSSGIDGALHVIDREWGRTRASHVARGVEYRWDPDSKWSRAALADTRFPDISLPNEAKWEAKVDDGDTQHWTMSGRLEIGMTADAFLDGATKQIVEKGWTLRETANGKREFTHTDNDGRRWLFTLESRPNGSALDEAMTISAER